LRKHSCAGGPPPGAADGAKRSAAYRMDSMEGGAGDYVTVNGVRLSPLGIVTLFASVSCTLPSLPRTTLHASYMGGSYHCHPHRHRAKCLGLTIRERNSAVIGKINIITWKSVLGMHDRREVFGEPLLCRGALVTKNRELGSLPFEDPANEIESEPERCESSVSARRHPLQIFYGQAGAVRLVTKPM